MIQIVLIIVGIAVLAVLLTRKGRETAAGICASALDQTVRKKANKEKILDLLRERELSNSEIREALGVSPRTIVGYMDELEAEGRVEQVGKAGQNVLYRLK